MHVFRSAIERHDARDGVARYNGGDREITERRKERREGTSEETLRRHLTDDLASLMNTVNLDAVVDLSDTPFVAKSILNYGFGDVSKMSNSTFAAKQISDLIRDTLVDHEPRLIASTLEIHVNKDLQEATQRLSFDITAEMVATPVDIPLGFVADVDMGAGKIQMTKLKVAT